MEFLDSIPKYKQPYLFQIFLLFINSDFTRLFLGSGVVAV